METYAIELGKLDILRLLKPKTASYLLVEVQKDGEEWRHTVSVSLQSSINREAQDWLPLTEIERDCAPIIRAVCEAAGVTFADILRKDKSRKVADARRLLVYECCREWGHIYSTIAIGEMVHRDHSSVVYLRGTVEALKNDRNFKRLFKLYKSLKK